MSRTKADGARSRTLLAARWLVLLLAASSSARGEGPAEVDFAHDVVPVIKAHCAKCHTDGTYKGSFSLDTRETMLKSKSVVPGKANSSELIERLTSDDPEFRMPPKGERLKADEVKRLTTWINEGATWEPGFRFKRRDYVAPLKPKRPKLPEAREGRTHPIDRIIDAYQAAHGVSTPPAPADPATFARRLSLDVIGLLPTPDELKAYVDDPSAERRAALIRRTLDDRRAYADHWLTFWNDLLRNDYAGTGYIDGGRKQVSAWLYASLLDNTPYDRFVRELISPKSESEGFIKGIKWRGRVNASQVQEVQFSQNVSQVFFGVNMKCASCHDSFIDKWKLDDAYGLAAVIAETPLEIARCDKPTGRFASPRFLWPELGSIDPAKPKAERLATLAGLVTNPDNGRFSRTIVNRIWQRLMGRGIVHPVDVMANEPWSEDLLDHLATYLIDHQYDLKALIGYVVTSEAYRARPSVVSDVNGEYVFQGPGLKRMTAEQFLDAVWMITGTGPTKIDAPITPKAEAVAPGHRFIRAALVKSNPLLRSLGRPNREQVVTTRGDLFTTLEALDLSNGELFDQALGKGASTILQARPGVPADELADTITMKALGRRPAQAESVSAREMLGSPVTAEGLADFLWAVFMLPEFQLVR